METEGAVPAPPDQIEPTTLDDVHRAIAAARSTVNAFRALHNSREIALCATDLQTAQFWANSISPDVVTPPPPPPIVTTPDDAPAEV